MSHRPEFTMDVEGSIGDDESVPDNLSKLNAEVVNNNQEASIGNPQTGLGDKRDNRDNDFGTNCDDEVRADSAIDVVLSDHKQMFKDNAAQLKKEQQATTKSEAQKCKEALARGVHKILTETVQEKVRSFEALKKATQSNMESLEREKELEQKNKVLFAQMKDLDEKHAQ